MCLRRFLLAATLLAAAAAALAPPAFASQVYRFAYRDSSSGPLLYNTVVQALPGETNNVSVAYDPAGRVYVIEDKAGVTVAPAADPAGQACVARNSTTVACSWPQISHIGLGDGDDRLVVTSAAAPDTVRVERDRAGRGVHGLGAPRRQRLGWAGRRVMIRQRRRRLSHR